MRFSCCKTPSAVQSGGGLFSAAKHRRLRKGPGRRFPSGKASPTEGRNDCSRFRWPNSTNKEMDEEWRPATKHHRLSRGARGCFRQSQGAKRRFPGGKTVTDLAGDKESFPPVATQHRQRRWRRNCFPSGTAAPTQTREEKSLSHPQHTTSRAERRREAFRAATRNRESRRTTICFASGKAPRTEGRGENSISQ